MNDTVEHINKLAAVRRAQTARAASIATMNAAMEKLNAAVAKLEKLRKIEKLERHRGLKKH